MSTQYIGCFEEMSLISLLSSNKSNTHFICSSVGANTIKLVLSYCGSNDLITLFTKLVLVKCIRIVFYQGVQCKMVLVVNFLYF